MAGVLDVLSAVIGIVGIGGNSLVCMVIWRVKDLHSLTNAFIFNQAVADLLSSAVFLLYSTLPVPVSLPSGITGWLLCHVWVSQTLLWLFMNTSSVGLAALTLERYLAIVFPFRYRVLTSSRRLPAIAITSTWIIGFGLGCVSSILLVEYSEGDNRCRGSTLAPASNPIHGVVFALYIVYFTATAATMLVAYAHITVVLKRRARRRTRLVPMVIIRRQPEVADSQRGLRSAANPLLRARRNVIMTLMLVSAVYIVCWLPNEIMSALGTTGMLLRVSVVLVAANSCVNPVIYAMKYRSFRNGLKQFFFERA